MNSLKHWLFLAASILLEVTGTSLMKASQTNFPMAGMIAMYVLLGVSYFLLARAVLRIPIGVAYAFWEGFGLVLIALVSVVALHEPLTLTRVFALALVLLGSALVHHGTHSSAAEEEENELSHNQSWTGSMVQGGA